MTGLLDDLATIGRNARGGYDRFAWTSTDAALREWFGGRAASLGLDLETDRNGNLWAWRGADLPGTALVLGSHLDSVPSGGAFDGPLGIASAFAALESLGDAPLSRPVAVVAFAEEEGARFGVACVGSRLMTGALSAERARALTDDEGARLGEVVSQPIGHDAERLARIGEFVELHVEQGHLPASDGHAGLSGPIGVATSIWPHGRWRVDIAGQQNHAGTTALADRDDPVLALGRLILAVRDAAEREDALATIGRIAVHPGAVNAVAGAASAWIDARGADEHRVRRLIAGFGAVEESFTAATAFEAGLLDALGDVPRLPSGAGHDAGVLALAGVPSAMIIVRNPSGISHAPEECADDADVAAGVEAMAAVIRARAS
jgi:N-carbamoyl-L-amino-acid hydrolase